MEDNETQKLISLNNLSYYNSKIQGQVGDLWTRVNEIDDHMQWRIQYDEMPEANENYEGQIVQYLGTTDNTYTNGYFYKCVGAYSQGDPVFNWEQLNVQPSSGGGNTKYVINVTGSDYNYNNYNTTENKAVLQAIYDNYNNIKTSDVFFKEGNGRLYNIKYIVLNNNQLRIYITIPSDSGLVGFSSDMWMEYQIIISSTFSNGTVGTIYLNRDSRYLSKTTDYITYNNTSSYTPTGDYNPASKKYVDDNIPQKATLPTASVDNLGKIYQFTGTTDSTYTNGYFYKCVSDGAVTPTYSWENVNVQASSGGGSAKYSIVSTNSSMSLGNFNTQENIAVFNDILTDTDVCTGDICIKNSTLGEVVTAVSLDKSTYYLNVYFIDSGYNTSRGGFSCRMNILYSLSGSISNGRVTSISHTMQYLVMLPDSAPDSILIRDYSNFGIQEFSTSSTYAVGDFVYRDAGGSDGIKLYKCTTAVTVAGSWNASNWTDATTTEYLQDTLIGNALNSSY